MHESVDTSALLALRRMQQPGKPDVVARIISRFLEESDERLATLRQAAVESNPLAIEKAAHAVKGIAGTVGANEMTELSTRLEQVGREGRTDGAADLVSELQAALDRARPVFDQLRHPA